MSNRTFQDSQGDSWTITITVGAAMKLRDQLGVDIQKLVESHDGTLSGLLTDVWKIVEILALVLEDQVKKRGLQDSEFFERLTGDVLDFATMAFLEAVADSLPKLQRRPIQELMKKLNSTLDRATETMAEKVKATDVEAEILEKIEKIEF